MVEQILFDRIVGIAEQYLGPAAERFVTRQVAFHLNKKPEELVKADLPKLQEWVKVSLSLLTEDKKIVNDFSNQMKKLAE